MKSLDERPAFARWLVQQRQRLSKEQGKKLRQVDVIDAIKASGYPIRDDYYRAIESGAKSPGRETREVLGRFFGSAPPMRDAPDPDLESVMDLLRTQIAAVNALVDVLRVQAARPDDEAAVQAMVEALRHGARLVVEPPAPPPGTHP